MDDLVDRIASGKAELLGIDEICRRLDVTRSTFDRWVKNGLQQRSRVIKMPSGPSIQVRGKVHIQTSIKGEVSESSMTFPPPDIRIGNSPKWELETLKKWLRKNVRPGA